MVRRSPATRALHLSPIVELANLPDSWIQVSTGSADVQNTSVSCLPTLKLYLSRLISPASQP
jgi:hypothetical protein